MAVIGSDDKAGINDVIAESAMSSIMDCEDSVATAWMRRTKFSPIATGLADERHAGGKLRQGGRTITRTLAGDIAYTAADGSTASLKARALMLVRNVGHLMTNPAIHLADGSEIPEGIMDAFMTVTGALADLEARQNSAAGSVYIVKPKMHGPEEVAFASRHFRRCRKDAWSCRQTPSRSASWMRSAAPR